MLWRKRMGIEPIQFRCRFSIAVFELNFKIKFIEWTKAAGFYTKIKLAPVILVLSRSTPVALYSCLMYRRQNFYHVLKK